MKWLALVLVPALSLAQTITPGNVVTTDPTRANVFASKVSAPNVNQARVVDGITYTTVQAAINSLPATGGWVLVPPGIYAGPTRIPSNSRITGYVPGIPSATWNAASNFEAGTSPADRKVVFVYSSSLTLSNLGIPPSKASPSTSEEPTTASFSRAESLITTSTSPSRTAAPQPASH